MNILVVEDEPKVADLLSKGLRAEGYTATIARDGAEGAQLGLDGDFDLVILDIMLPKKDGRAVLREIRSRKPHVPIIMLTVKDDVDTKVETLDDGATDYLTKPFAFEELMARLRAHLRARDEPTSFQLSVGSLSLDLKAHEAEHMGEKVALSATEFRLLEFLMRHPRQVVSRAQLLDHVWGYEHDPETNIVDVYIGYLRRKLNLRAGPLRIETVRGAGYRLDGG